MRKVATPEPEGFAEFWDVWRPMARHTDGRGLAREAYRKHVLNGAMPEDIIDGARWFMRGVKDKQFVPLSATWLNREPWPDLCGLERAHHARQRERAQHPAKVTPIRAQLPDTHFSVQYDRRKAAGE